MKYELTAQQRSNLIEIDKYIYTKSNKHYIDFSDIINIIGFRYFEEVLESSGEQESFDLSLMEEFLDSQGEYTDSYEGRLYVRKSRWYGLNISYGDGYFNANYNYSSTNYNNPISLTYNKAVGSTPMKSGKLKRLCLIIPRVSATVDNLQLQVIKTTKTSGSNSVTTKVVYHEDTKEKGHYLLGNRSHFIEVDVDEEASVNDVFSLVINSSSSSSSTRYLYSTTIKWIYK